MIVRLEQGRRGVEADRLQADIPQVGTPSSRDQQRLAGYLAPAVEVDSDRLTAGLDRLCPALEQERDALALQHLAKDGTCLGLFHSEHAVHALDDRHLDPEAREDLRELDPDRAASKDDQRFWELLDLDRLAVGPVAHAVQPRDRWHRR